jgi:hypothetical protein
MLNALNNDTVCMVTGKCEMKVKVFSTGTEIEGVSLVMKARWECFVGCNFYIPIYM